MKPLVVVIAMLLLISPITNAQSTDKELVYAAVEDYVDALYLVQPDRIKKSVHPELMKKGFWKGKDKTDYTYQGVMTFNDLVKLAETWNAKGWLAKDAVKKIEIYDVQDQTASAKLTAYWGTDYFQLAKFDGKWMIVNILWQGPLPAQAKS
ncbi:MAG TPA: nuclear transport factor 2 family protein [Chryseosolibacter sp.]